MMEQKYQAHVGFSFLTVDLLSFIINEESLGFRLLVGQEKRFDTVSLCPGKLRKIDWIIYLILNK